MIPTKALRIRSLLQPNGQLELSLVEEPIPRPGPDDVVVRVQAAPINPSDLGQLFAGADLGSLRQSGSPARPVVTATVSRSLVEALAARVDRPMGAGNEGAGEVVAAGDSPAAQAMLGRTVASFAGEMYAQFRCVPVAQCVPLPANVTPVQGASCFVNPMTVLGLVETARAEGHAALVHTAAASNLGQMLNRVCLEDRLDLVNIVRSDDQERLLRSQGARFVCNSAAPSFDESLSAAIAATNATIAFDAIGGGGLADRILAAMEAVQARKATGYSLYGTSTRKQLYIYGALDTNPTILRRNYGAAWGIAGWLLPQFMQRVGPETVARMQRRVMDGLLTTFASHYAEEISLAGALDVGEIARYAQRATNRKVLIDPQRSRD
jgi:NADPH:quinone reductase-like Zn-dependent oxidoreductase